jgi:hypothetical protein
MRLAMIATPTFEMVLHQVGHGATPKNRGFVHIAPKTRDAQLEKFAHILSKPGPCSGMSKIREMAGARPYRSNIEGTIGVTDKYVFSQAFIVDAVAWINFDARIYDGYQPYAFAAKVLDKALRIGKAFRVPGKNAVAIHVVDVQMHNVERNASGPKFGNQGTDDSLRIITPPALMVAQGPIRG